MAAAVQVHGEPQIGLRGKLKLNEPMSRHVSWRAGGRAEQCYVPADLADLVAFLRSDQVIAPVHFIGLGSNLLVRDGGLKGTVILLHGALKHIERTAEGLIYAEAGVASPKLASFAAQKGFEGAEFLAGIPGTVGGALAMNAGCYGHETWEWVEKVRVINARGELQDHQPLEYDIGYRHVKKILDQGDEWFVAAWFKFAPGDGKAARERIKELLARRMASQPLTEPNAGSVFRNPPGDYAARLVEACGLKGRRIGGAEVSAKHANFIVNAGKATARDIESLIESVQAEVWEKFGVELVREVKIIGDKQ